MLTYRAAILATVLGVAGASGSLTAQAVACGDAGAAPCAPSIQRRALVIGVSRYPRLEASKQLRFADADARAFADFLKGPDGPRLPEPNVRLLVNDSASVPLILRELRGLLRDSRAGDVAIVYFAGHGTEEDGEAPRRAFLLASDAARQSELDIGGIEFSQLQSWLDKFVEKKVRIILVTDACRSGGIAVSESYTRGAATALQRRFNGVTQLLSSDGDELSMEGEQWGSARLGQGHGVYTYYLLEGWRGMAADTATGIVTLRGLQDFVRDQVRKATGERQSPQHAGSLRDTLLTLAPQTVAAMRRSPSATTIGSVVASSGAAASVGTRDAGTATPRASDTLTLRLVRDFRDAIISGRLTSPATTSALAFYDQLRARRSGQQLAPVMRDELVASMQQDADRIIHRYLEGGNDQPRPAAFREAGLLLAQALTLLPATDPARRTMIAHRDFLLGFATVRANDRPRFAVAERQLRRAISLEPRAAYAYNALGWLKLNLGSLDSAQRLFEAAISKAPRWQYPRNNLAIVYQQRGEHERAIAAFRTALAGDSLGATAYNNLGNVYASLGRYTEAERLYRRATRAQPGLHTARGNLAALYRSTGRYALARAYLDTAFALLGRDTLGADSVWTLIEAGRLHLDLLDFAAADSAFQRAAKGAPGHAESYYYLGETRRYAGDFAHAEQSYREALARNPRHAWSYQGLSALYRRSPSPNYPRALGVLGVAKGHLPRSPDVAFFEGWLHDDWSRDSAATPTERTRAFANAQSAYLRVLGLDSLYGLAYSSLGELFESRQRWDDAARWYERAVANADSSADARYALSEFYRRRADGDSARSTFWRARQDSVLRELIAIDPAFVSAYNALAVGAIEREAFDSAAALFRMSSSLGFSATQLPQQARALQARGAALERAGRPAAAVRAYEAALSLDASFLDGSLGLARARYLAGVPAPALVAADSLLSRARDDGERREIELLRARILIDLERPAEALTAADRALPRDTTFLAAELHIARALAQDAAARVGEGPASDRARAAAVRSIAAFLASANAAEDLDRTLSATFSRGSAERFKRMLDQARRAP